MTNILPFRRPAEDGSLRPVRRDIAAELTGAIVGRAPHDFCLHFKFAGADRLSIASAPIWCRDRVAEAGFPPGPAVVLFTGRDIDGAPAFATVATADWRPAVLRLSATPTYAFAERIHLLSWIGADQPESRRAMSAEIGRRIAAHGSGRRLCRDRTDLAPLRSDLDATALAALVLIAATAPDMLDGIHP